MKLTLRKIMAMTGAIVSLKGRDRVVRVNNEDQIVSEPYKIDDDALIALAINGNRLREFGDSYTSVRNTKIGELLSEDRNLDPGSPGHTALALFDDSQMSVVHDVKLYKIKVSDLKLSENDKNGTPIPPHVLIPLTPIIKHDLPKDAEEE